jgi:hypothetical protein
VAFVIIAFASVCACCAARRRSMVPPGAMVAPPGVVGGGGRGIYTAVGAAPGTPFVSVSPPPRHAE